MTERPALVVGLNAVILAVTEDQPRVLTLPFASDTPMEGGAEAGASEGLRMAEALPTGPLDPTGDLTLELALRRWVRRYTGVDLGYVEQLYTFGDRFRDPREEEGGARVLSVAYLALVRESPPPSGLRAHWRPAYAFLPWEDFRRGRPRLMDTIILPALGRWIDQGLGVEEKQLRRERASIAFGLGPTPLDGERVLERYELLYEIGLVPEADGGKDLGGCEMVYDHRRVLATALGRIRAKLKYRPMIFELLPEHFTLFGLQKAVESLAGRSLHKQNFRRLVLKGGLVEGTGRMESQTGGRPAELYRFRREVLLERPAPGVGLPGFRT